MKSLRLLILSVVMFITALFGNIYASDLEKMVAISADGNKISYLLGDVKKIEVYASKTEASMTVLSKDGTSENNIIKILFAQPITKIEEIGVASVYVYPNPVSHTLNIMGVEEDALLYVYSLSGQCVLQDKGTTLEVTSLLQGTYILRINDNYVKFIKK